MHNLTPSSIALLILAPPAVAIALWTFCSIFIAYERRNARLWTESCLRERLAAGLVGATLVCGWQCGVAFVAPVYISMIRGRDIPWSDLSPTALLLDTATVVFIGGAALTGISIGVDIAEGVLKRFLRSRGGCER